MRFSNSQVNFASSGRSRAFPRSERVTAAAGAWDATLAGHGDGTWHIARHRPAWPDTIPKRSLLAIVNLLLDEPALAGIDIGSPEWFSTQRQLINDRPLVLATYRQWYEKMLGDARSAPEGHAQILELGSGSNFVKLLEPDVITSDIFPGISDMVVDAQALPFPDASLRAIFLTHVFHHIPSVDRFFKEAIRTLVPGGVISLIDVAHTPFSHFFFTNCHPEGYHPDRRSWELVETEPLGGANQAMTWMVFARDIERFRSAYPELELELIEYLPWLGYLCSGGLTRRNLVPDVLVPILRRLDQTVRPLDRLMALHWHIRVRRRLPNGQSQ